ncbi:Gfo/Idh/MocA family oxidoreductase [Allokutzneria sp. A3M-2-11 16]|uniref:Gfo/Idh/MocA family protein n=1 Tax=Allokutzneria sp. A3M-2-11 16 TaxID=2962043 RepID=UPI0020B8B873|nr:Gfo/Idh/MocA family oxidoreductase [Allokutzneria sp. A3M-2-11 16]MCP3801920.1 Gfo/Idh/MocA family oxidoreductase [Allokutzneria sp. A3M-2-11 16]
MHRIGIIGTGLQAVRRAQSIVEADDARLVSVAGATAKAAEAFAANYDIRAAPDWQSIVDDDDLDVVMVCVPPHLHAEMTIAALRAGKHVLCEKPLARSAAEAEDMCRAAEETGRVLACGFNHRHHPALVELRELIDSGALGRSLWARVAYGIGGREGYEREWRADPRKVSGGQLMEQGIHVIDLLRSFFGEIDAVTGVRATSVLPIAPLEEDAMALVRHQSGVMATVHSSLTQWVNAFRFEVGGDSAVAEVSGLAGSYGVQTLTVWQRTTGPFSATRKEFRSGDRSWAREWAAFGEMLAEPESGLASARDGAAAIRVVEAIYSAADELRWEKP